MQDMTRNSRKSLQKWQKTRQTFEKIAKIMAKLQQRRGIKSQASRPFIQFIKCNI